MLPPQRSRGPDSTRDHRADDDSGQGRPDRRHPTAATSPRPGHPGSEDGRQADVRCRGSRTWPDLDLAITGGDRGAGQGDLAGTDADPPGAGGDAGADVPAAYIP